MIDDNVTIYKYLSKTTYKKMNVFHRNVTMRTCSHILKKLRRINLTTQQLTIVSIKVDKSPLTFAGSQYVRSKLLCEKSFYLMPKPEVFDSSFFSNVYSE